MSEYAEVLSRALEHLTEARDAAVRQHGLVPDSFDWLVGEVRHPMEPQPISTDGGGFGGSPIFHDSYRSTVTVYGGRIANVKGRFVYGHVQADISEPTPVGVKHQSGHHGLPVPYIPRLLTIHEGLVTVDTPSKDRPKGQGPVVFEGMNSHGRYRVQTCYDIRTGELTVRTGDLVTDGHGWSDDRTVAQDISTLETAVAEARVVTMTRTLLASTEILRKVAAQDTATMARVSTTARRPAVR